MADDAVNEKEEEEYASAKKAKQRKKSKIKSDDLMPLEISNKDLRKLSGLSPKKILRPPFGSTVPKELFESFLASIFFGGGFGWFLSLFTTKVGSWALAGIFAGILMMILVLDLWEKLSFSRKNRSFISLLDDVERYNSVLRAVDVNDQIKAAGNAGMKDEERKKVVDALALAREDLIRALKTERILRENADVTSVNVGEFDADLAALHALQINDQASEQGRLLNETLQVAVGVRDEMRKLQGQRVH